MNEQHVQALIVRALKTFLQAFLGTILVALTPALSLGTAKAALLAAAAAGLSAVMNVYLKPVEAK